MSGWTDARVARLKALRAEGYSASQVAEALGGVSRDAVLGKLHRLKLGQLGSRIRTQTQTYQVLAFIGEGKRPNREIAQHLDVDGGDLARTLGSLCDRGLLVNLRPGQPKALYALTEKRRAAIQSTGGSA